MITDLRKLKPDISMLRTLRGRWRQHPRYRGCVGHWLFNEGGGGESNDISANGSTGTLVNDPEWQTGPSGFHLDFDGTNDHITIDNKELHNITGDWTGTLWIRGDVISDNDVIVGKEQNAPDRATWQIQYRDSGGTVYYGYYHHEGGGDYSPILTFTNYTPTAGVWDHLVMTRDVSASSVTMYINGIPIQTLSWSSDSPSAHNAGMKFGQTDTLPAGRYFNGALHDFRLYNRSLSAPEVKSLYSHPFLEFEWAYKQQRNHAYHVFAAAPATVPRYMHQYRRRRVA